MTDPPRRPSVKQRLESALRRVTAPPVARDAFELAAVGCSVTLLICYAVWPGLSELVLDNALPRMPRLVGVLAVMIAAVLTPLGGLLAHRLIHRRDRSTWRNELRFRRLIRALRPLSLAFLLPVLFDTEFWRKQQLFAYALALGFAAVMGWWLVVRRSPPGSARVAAAQRLAPYLVLAAIAAYVAYTSFYTLRRHYLLQTHAYDLGIFENALASTLNGEILYSSLEGVNHLGVHFSPILLALVPAYALVPRAETLLIAQCVVIGLAAWPLYLMGRHLLGAPLAAAFIAVAYLIHPAVGGANFYDFHELAFGPLPFFFAFYFWLKERWWPFWISVALLLLVKEDMGIAAVVLGAYSIARRKTAVGINLMLLGWAVFPFLEFVVIPQFSHHHAGFSWYYQDLIANDQGLWGLLQTFLSNPVYALRQFISTDKALYLLQMLSPLFFLCLRDFGGWLLMSYPLLMSLGASKTELHLLGMQYPLQVLPYALVAALMYLGSQRRTDGRAVLGQRQKRLLVSMAILSVLVCYHHGMIYPRSNFLGGFGPVRFDYTDADQRRYDDLRFVADQLPPDASVTASEAPVAHVAGRSRVWTVRYAEFTGGMSPEYLLVSRRDGHANLKAILSRHTYETVSHRGDVELLRRASMDPPATAPTWPRRPVKRLDRGALRRGLMAPKQDE